MLRRIRVLYQAALNLLRLFQALRTAPSLVIRDQDLQEPFPKMIFDLPTGIEQTPGGLSAAYLQLAVASWQHLWSAPGNGAASPYDAALRIIHADIQRAHALECAVLESLDAGE